VKIAQRTFTCLRVFDIERLYDVPERNSILAEAYLTRSGRTVLFRRYNARLWALHPESTYDGPPWDERFPQNTVIVINGITFVHWYDVLSDLACGVRGGRASK